MSARTAIRRWLVRLASAVLIVFATIVIGGALDARRRLPDLEPWHRFAPRDARAGDFTAQSTLADYLAIEGRAFTAVHDEIESKLDPASRVPANRYNPDGIASPGRLSGHILQRRIVGIALGAAAVEGVLVRRVQR